MDPAAGVVLQHAVGDRVDEGEPLAAVFSRDPARRAQASRILETVFDVGEEPPVATPIVIAREDAAG